MKQASRTLLSELGTADLMVDRIFEGGRRGNYGDDPLHKLLGVSIRGGFRILGTRESPRLVVLTTSLADPDWPDGLDEETGRFTYYGDNKEPGNDLHETGRWGNQLLNQSFAHAHAGAEGRRKVPPFLIFASAGYYRDVRFLGLAVPGEAGLPPTEDLIAVWKSSDGNRFQNYRGIFTVLNVQKISRAWLDHLRDPSKYPAVPEPDVLNVWRRTGSYSPLKAEKAIRHRKVADQVPVKSNHRKIVKLVVETFKNDEVRFERCAGRICEMMLGNVTHLEITRPSRDGGRDGMGKYRVGGPANGVDVEFALEAKCYALHRGVGVRAASRLISRLRHRQFGVLVTTSYLGEQAYKEIQEDGHPVIIVSGRDIAEILEQNGLGNETELRNWLSQF